MAKGFQGAGGTESAFFGTGGTGTGASGRNGVAARLRSRGALAQAVRHALGRHLRALRLLTLGLTSAAALAGALAGGGCSSGANDAPFDPRMIQGLERGPADAYAPPPRPFPTTREDLPTSNRSMEPISPRKLPTTIPTGGLAGTDSPTVRLSLREVIQRAVANSAEVRVAGYDPAINAQKVIQQQGQFDPNFITNITVERQDTQTAGTPILLSTGRETILRTNKANIYTYEAGFQQNLYSGGKASLTYQVNSTDFDTPNDYRITNPYWENQLKFQVTQPLLRGFGTEVNEARITIAKDDQRISTLEFRKTLEDTIDQIEQDYWQLYDAEQQVLFDQQLVENSLRTYQILFERERKGVDKDAAGGVPTAQAETRVRADQAVLIAAQQRVRDVSMDLKRRMNDPAFPVSNPVVVLPADNPIQVPIEFNLKDQIDTAMNNRLELGEQQVRIDEAAVLLQTARNGELPQLDVVASAAVQGLAGEWSTALRNQGEFNHISYQIGVQFSYPIGDRGPKAATRQAQLQRQQAIAQYENLAGQIALDVELNWDAVYSAYKQAVERQQSRLAAERQVERINLQITSGVAQLTPPFVQVQLQAQEDLANAQREESIALSNYNIAIEKLEKSKGTLLRYDNIIMEEDPHVARDNGK